MKKVCLLFVFCFISVSAGLFAQPESDLIQSGGQSDLEYYEEKGIDIFSSQKNQFAVKRIERYDGDIPELGVFLIPNSADEHVMAFDPYSGELIDLFFFPGQPADLTTPIHVLWNFDQTGFLVSDQSLSMVQQFDTDGLFEKTFAPVGGQNYSIMRNIRGMCMKENGNLLVTVFMDDNAHSIIMFDTDGDYLGRFIEAGAGGLNGPWGIIYRPEYDDYLVSASGSSGIHRYDSNGEFIEMFVTGINFPQQMQLLNNGNVLVTNFSPAADSGVYEYDSEGSLVGYYDVVTGLRGVQELYNGNLMVTNSSGVHIINRNNELVGTVISGQARHISLITPSGIDFYALNLEVKPEGTGTVTGTGYYPENYMAAVTATPEIYYQFENWTDDDGNIVSEEPNFEYPMPAKDITLTANFFEPPTYMLTLNAEPEDGGTVEGEGEYMEGEEVDISAIAHEGWGFIEWSGDIEHVDDPGSATPTVTMPAKDIELTANFEMLYYQLTLEANPYEGGSVHGGGEFNMGEMVDISADPNEGWLFVEWTGDTQHAADPQEAETTVTMPAEDITLTANFEEIPPELFMLNLSAEPPEGGNVHGDGEYEEGETVDISADPNEGWLFIEWTGDTQHAAEPEEAETTVTMPAEDISLTANFEEIPPGLFILTLSAEPPEGGNVHGDGEYEEGETVDISADPNEGWLFIEWTGDTQHAAEPEEAETTVTMPAEDISLTANFEEIPPELFILTLSTDPPEGGNVHGDGEYEEGEDVTVTAMPNEGWLFLEWTDEDGETVSEEESFVYTMPNKDVTLIANFETLPSYTLTLTADPANAGTVDGDGEYEAGETVQIAATPVDVDWEFENWSGDIEHVDNPESATAIVTMPDKNIALTANFIFISVDEIPVAGINVFPNPARDKFYVESNEMIKQIRVMDISGQVIKEIAVDALNAEINVNNFNAGVYFLQFYTTESLITKTVKVVR